MPRLKEGPKKNYQNHNGKVLKSINSQFLFFCFIYFTYTTAMINCFYLLICLKYKLNFTMLMSFPYLQELLLKIQKKSKPITLLSAGPVEKREKDFYKPVIQKKINECSNEFLSANYYVTIIPMQVPSPDEKIEGFSRKANKMLLKRRLTLSSNEENELINDFDKDETDLRINISKFCFSILVIHIEIKLYT
ncbi:hypothetical protein BpHYR1_021704 [Brachionus plicatilis]|uniref:Uncharacterized protein n=1 Tax=Brachionus plicatilis TaxID=10195 RepID=A0A3M7T5K8_BRAPC|nr:hypothetical protein BpHYR1_021704 [Brachionus plicatilis]